MFISPVLKTDMMEETNIAQIYCYLGNTEHQLPSNRHHDNSGGNPTVGESAVQSHNVCVCVCVLFLIRYFVMLPQYSDKTSRCM